MKTNCSNRNKFPTFTNIRKTFSLLVCLFSFNACLLNPIVHSLLFPEKDPSRNSLFVLWALLSNSNSVVELNRTWAGIYKGESLQLEAQYYSYGAKTDSTFQWTSNNDAVATVSPTGLVQSIGNGKVIITVASADGRASATSAITVYSGYVYTSLDFNNSVALLTMDNSTGLLTFNASALVGTSQPTGIGVDPAGKFLYTGDFGGATISQFLINQTTGALTSNTPVFVAAGANPRNLVTTPDSRFLYLASEGTSAIRAFAINPNGTLTFLNSYPTMVRGEIQISRNGNFIFYMNPSVTEITSYRINYSDGSLSQVGVSPTFPNNGPGHVSTHPNGKYLYVGTFPAVTVLSFDSNFGQMGFVDSVFYGMSINSTAIHPSGRFLYLVHINEGVVSCYTVDPNTGKISYSSNVSGYSGNSLRFMVIDPSGRFAYVAANTGNNLFQFSINQITGELTPMGTANAGGPQWNLTFL
ncbi:6-phosphogluconolactonase [Leptospira harrisiae]|uniref:6-phosphogluconolactonase n=2 Tax=Leptospira harrisiae TaxID=2023189 RepID=A0A2N0AQ77_9LEPT|nr:beta-propeller fold lactonase family protein [Leptospira harrisiae]PJZ86452.1 6-phosphogluconolactonase [Leptospira harrisiae]PKA10016.1 6-phosphogluconolactonase [Leptospira harrisiae]